MSFKPPFKNEYTEGDLIYGLDNVRTSYINEHPAFKKIENSINALMDNYAATKTEREKQEMFAVPVPSQQNEFQQALQNHSKYKSAYSGVGFLVRGRHLNVMFDDPADIVKKCKAGLYWATQKQAFQVHFLLDEINFEEVVLKSNRQDCSFDNVRAYLKIAAKHMKVRGANLRDHYYPERSIKTKSITGSELRWIYRNREDAKVQKIIQFWYKDKPCCPPWDEYFDKYYGRPIAHLWLNYKPKSARQEPRQTNQQGAVVRLAALFEGIH